MMNFEIQYLPAAEPRAFPPFGKGLMIRSYYTPYQFYRSQPSFFYGLFRLPDVTVPAEIKTDECLDRRLAGFFYQLPAFFQSQCNGFLDEEVFTRTERSHPQREVIFGRSAYGDGFYFRTVYQLVRVFITIPDFKGFGQPV